MTISSSLAESLRDADDDNASTDVVLLDDSPSNACVADEDAREDEI